MANCAIFSTTGSSSNSTLSELRASLFYRWRDLSELHPGDCRDHIHRQPHARHDSAIRGADASQTISADDQFGKRCKRSIVMNFNHAIISSDSFIQIGRVGL